MKNFTYYDGNYSLHIDASDWLISIGLRETLWILDIQWLYSSYDIRLTYNDWIKDK